MDNIKISVCASAIHPNFWMKSYNSLKSNKLPWELIYCGDVQPHFKLPPNFKYIYSKVKPAQCYQIAFNNAIGELILWTADDAHYEDHAIDSIYAKYIQRSDKKIVVGLRTIEDGRDITNVHRLMSRIYDSPIMTPFGAINRKLFNELGGYDRRFICGQSENDVVMRVKEIDGEVAYCDKKVFVEHDKVHKEWTVFRNLFYTIDRRVLESFWIRDGKIVNKRLLPVERFSNKDITTISQSNKGKW